MPDQESRKPTGAENVRWDLSDLYDSPESATQALEKVRGETEKFARRYRGRIADLDSEALEQSLKAFEALQDQLDRAYTYAFLYWSTNTEDPKRGALLQKIREEYTSIAQQLIFFEIEMIRLPEQKLESAMEEVPKYRHFFETRSLQREHVLSEAEEKIVAEKSITGIGAWSRFFDETLGAARFDLNGDSLTEQEILARLYAPERDTRRSAAMAFTEGLRRHLRTLTYVFNTSLAEKASEDRLRGYSHWLASRNLSNEISDESVQALVDAVTGRYDLVSRYYRLKKELLGLDQLYDYDRYAPLARTEKKYSWEEARTLVLDGYASFHSRMGEIAERFFKEDWIDAAVSPGKQGGAFSHRAVPQVHPYILMNYTGNARDVQTLAHELGHGVHQYLARGQGSIMGGTPLTTAETASVFGEMLVFERLLRREKDDSARLSLLLSKIDDSIATVFRQVSMNQFEDRIHGARRSEGELTAERFSELWIETQNQMFEESVALGDHYGIWWSYIPHFIHTPGYVYAYAFGELLVLALYAIYRNEGPAFAEKYLDLLHAGGSDWPHELLARMDVDLRDPKFWDKGLSEIESLVSQAEELAGR